MYLYFIFSFSIYLITIKERDSKFIEFWRWVFSLCLLVLFWYVWLHEYSCFNDMIFGDFEMELICVCTTIYVFLLGFISYYYFPNYQYTCWKTRWDCFIWQPMDTSLNNNLNNCLRYIFQNEVTIILSWSLWNLLESFFFIAICHNFQYCFSFGIGNWSELKQGFVIMMILEESEFLIKIFLLFPTLFHSLRQYLLKKKTN